MSKKTKTSRVIEVTDPNISELMYECWALHEEKIVYDDEDFVIVRFLAAPGKSKTGFIYEVIPKSKKGGRLDDWQICPEPDTLEKAMKLVERNRQTVRRYKKAHNLL